MCLICFISHLVPLVLGSLFVCKNFCKKLCKPSAWEANGRGKGAWAHMAASVDAMWSHPTLPCPYHITDPWEKPGGTPRRPPTPLINVGLIQRIGQGEALLDPWAHYHTLEGLHRLKNCLLTK
jgi:hypothetical protein